jgi:hypothetical protein
VPCATGDVHHVVRILTRLQTVSVDAHPLQRQPASALACDVKISISEILNFGEGAGLWYCAVGSSTAGDVVCDVSKVRVSFT